jgi:phage terminase small subunit
MLTTKQEKFVQNLLKGMSQREAYKSSYNASNMKDETIDVKASLLFKQDKIRVRYEELTERTTKKTIITAQERMEFLTRIILGEEAEAYLQDKMKAVDLLNKMDGQYIQRIESNSNVTIDNPYKNLTEEELKRLAGG